MQHLQLDEQSKENSFASSDLRKDCFNTVLANIPEHCMSANK